MAEKTKATSTASQVTETKAVDDGIVKGFVLPLLDDPKAPQEEFYSVNFKNYMVKRGCPVDLPREVVDVITAQTKAKAEALAFIQANPVKEQ